jgi:hypothetical protein
MESTIINEIDGKELEAMGFGSSPEDVRKLLADAKEAYEEDQRLTIREALHRFTPAVFWAMILSVTLIMEVSRKTQWRMTSRLTELAITYRARQGYDVVMVRHVIVIALRLRSPSSAYPCRSDLSTVNSNSSSALVPRRAA